MPLRKAHPRTFAPAGLSDALDEAMAFPGSCTILQNLMPDPTSRNIWIARPGSVQLTAFAGFTTPGVISCLTIIGNRAYGLIATGRNAGNDEPFSFNLLTQTFDTVSGVTAGNTPLTPASSGTWTPPTMALCGALLVVTHPGYTGAGGMFFGWFNVSVPTAPTWNAGNTTGTALPSVPVAVATYMDRSWFAVNPAGTLSATYFTDTAALSIAAGTQIITYGDNTPISALRGMPFSNVLGGIVQSLLVFKGTVNGVYNIYQVTGDASQTSTSQIGVGGTSTTILQSSLQVNSLNIATTTQGPNSIAATPKGVLFVSPDGLRLINQQGQVEDPIGSDGKGINAPFLALATPSRLAAAATSAVYRVSFQNPNVVGTPYQEFWFDLIRNKWSGPHTFPARLISGWNNTFVVAPQTVAASLWRSDPYQSAISVYTENGAQLTFDLRTALWDDGGRMQECSVVETTVDTQIPPTQTLTVQAFDESASLLDQFNSAVTSAASLWGTMIWGTGLWSGAAGGYRPRRIDWHLPLVYRRLQLDFTGNCSGNFRIGKIYVREQTLGYSQMIA